MTNADIEKAVASRPLENGGTCTCKLSVTNGRGLDEHCFEHRRLAEFARSLVAHAYEDAANESERFAGSAGVAAFDIALAIRALKGPLAVRQPRRLVRKPLL